MVKKIGLALSLVLAATTTTIWYPCFADDSIPLPTGMPAPRNLVAEAEKLRIRAWEQSQAKDLPGSLQSISDCANLLNQKEYYSANKNQMIEAVCSQLDNIQSQYRGKRDWAGGERVCRKKIEIMEMLKHTDNNDYQGCLQELEICLRAQNKSTELGTLRAKMKPLRTEADKPLPALPNEPPPPPQEKD